MRSIIILVLAVLFAVPAAASDRVAYSWDAFGCFTATYKALPNSASVRACGDKVRHEHYIGFPFKWIKAFRNRVSVVYLMQTQRYLEWSLPLGYWRTAE